MEQLGDKEMAKVVAKGVVPLVPGGGGRESTDDDLLKVAMSIGWPVLLKAAAGGGGKGMRVVRSREQWKDCLSSCKAEVRRWFQMIEGKHSLALQARNSFGDETILVEKYIERVKHIEVQILGDEHGNVMALGERDCSFQRRHQKVIEESPCVILR